MPSFSLKLERKPEHWNLNLFQLCLLPTLETVCTNSQILTAHEKLLLRRAGDSFANIGVAWIPPRDDKTSQIKIENPTIFLVMIIRSVFLWA